jgi:hypothetical protein
LTASYAQTGSDTLTCYTPAELEKIANRVVYANECDTLLNVCEKQLVLKDTAIYALNRVVAAKDSVIAAKGDIINLKEDIITGKDIEIADLRDVLKKNNRKLKWTKIGWAGTSIVLTGIITILVLK